METPRTYPSCRIFLFVLFEHDILRMYAPHRHDTDRVSFIFLISVYLLLALYVQYYKVPESHNSVAYLYL
jgi:hypothetical protein